MKVSLSGVLGRGVAGCVRGHKIIVHVQESTYVVPINMSRASIQGLKQALYHDFDLFLFHICFAFFQYLRKRDLISNLNAV